LQIYLFLLFLDGVFLPYMSESTNPNMAFWSPDAKVEMTGAEFGALSQILDLALNPLGNYSLGDIITLMSMAKEARTAVLLRMQSQGQIMSEPETVAETMPESKSPTMPEPEPTANFVQTENVEALGFDISPKQELPIETEYADAAFEPLPTVIEDDVQEAIEPDTIPEPPKQTLDPDADKLDLVV
jgi:hypothetical protein